MTSFASAQAIQRMCEAAWLTVRDEQSEAKPIKSSHNPNNCDAAWLTATTAGCSSFRSAEIA